MRYREFPPGPELEDVVHRFWILQGTAPAGDAGFERAMPDGRPELIFNLGDPFERRTLHFSERQPPALVVGPTTRAMLIRPTGRVHVVGVRFRPGRWPALLGVAAEELVDRALALPDVAPRWRDDLLERLAETGVEQSRLALLRRRLLCARDRAPHAPRLQRAVDAAMRRPNALPVPRLAELAGVSERQLVRLWRAASGMGPKLLGRLTRFQRVLGAVERDSRPNWSALAHRNGYYDQAHLCRDFRRFAGISPARYLAARRDLTRHFVDGVGQDGDPGVGFFQDGSPGLP